MKGNFITVTDVYKKKAYLLNIDQIVVIDKFDDIYDVWLSNSKYLHISYADANRIFEKIKMEL